LLRERKGRVEETREEKRNRERGREGEQKRRWASKGASKGAMLDKEEVRLAKLKPDWLS
jgi:hypothetical protein